MTKEKMGEYSRFSSLVLIVIAIVVCIGSIRIGLGTLASPGSGFVPFIAALFLGLFSLPTLIKATLKKNSKETSFHEPINLRKVIKAVIGLVIYILLLPSIGYIIGTFCLMLFFFKGVETLKWKWAITTAILTVVASYLVFDVWLQCGFPVGLIDIKGLIRWIF
jgi:hypothetical protein